MIHEVISGFLGGFAILNGAAAFVLYRQYLALAEEAVSFAAVVVDAVAEQEDGSLVVDPALVVGESMDHLSRMTGMIRWIRG